MKLVKIPFSGGGLGHGNGANLAPDLVVKLLKNFFANEGGYTPSFVEDQIEVDESNIAISHENIEKYMSKLNEKAILIGGDHSISYPSIKGFAQTHNEFKLIVFDAHPDLMDDFVPPTQEDYLKVLIEEKILKPENVIIVGVRNWDKIEIDYINSKNINYISANEIFELDAKTISKKICDFANMNTYLSIDIDVVDPVEAIGTGYTEHGGLSSRELIYFLQHLKKTEKIRVVDIVEINPKKDINDMTSILGAKLITELSDF